MQIEASSPDILITKQKLARNILATLIRLFESDLRALCTKRQTTSILSSAQARILLTWLKANRSGMKHIYRSFAVLRGHDSPLELIEAAGSLVADLDETVSASQYDFESPAPASPSQLASFRTTPSNPEAIRRFDMKTLREQIELALDRCCWCIAFAGLEEVCPNLGGRLALHAAVLTLHDIEYQKRAMGITLGEYIRAQKSMHSSLLTEIFEKLNAETRGLVAPTDPETSFEWAIARIENERGFRPYEQQVTRNAYPAAHNAYTEAGYSEDTKNHNMLWGKLDRKPICRAIARARGWILSPLVSAADTEEYSVYIPLRISDSAALGNVGLAIEYVKGVPADLNKPIILEAISIEQDPLMSRFLQISVSATSPTMAWREACNRVALLFDVLFCIDGYQRVHRNINMRHYAVVSSRGSTTFNLSSMAGKPETSATVDQVNCGVEVLQRLSSDNRLWCQQLSRTPHLLRLYAEADNPEVKFLHSWQVLETLVGHLTKESKSTAVSQMRNTKGIIDKARSLLNRHQIISHKSGLHLAVDLLALCRCRASVDFGKLKSTKKRSAFDKERNSVRESMTEPMLIRNRWAVHTGDERAGSLRSIDPATLEHSSKWLVEECLYLFNYLVDLALSNAELKNRSDVAEHLEKELIDT